jgi:hypothetical protein
VATARAAEEREFEDGADNPGGRLGSALIFARGVSDWSGPLLLVMKRPNRDSSHANCGDGFADEAGTG